MDVLLTAFKGNNNSSKILLDLISSKRYVDELYLDNDFRRCEVQMNQQMDRKTYDVIYSFEQKEDSDAICLEMKAIKEGACYETEYCVADLSAYLKERHYGVEVSEDAGVTLPNHIYAVGLNRIKKEMLPTKMVLIHLPPVGKIDILQLAKDFSHYLSHLIDEYK